jgi:hypothetical protein
MQRRVRQRQSHGYLIVDDEGHWSANGLLFLMPDDIF